MKARTETEKMSIPSHSRPPSVILSLSKDPFGTSDREQTELILRQAQDDKA